MRIPKKGIVVAQWGPDANSNSFLKRTLMTLRAGFIDAREAVAKLGVSSTSRLLVMMVISHH